jgi:hypothetical protein
LAGNLLPLENDGKEGREVIKLSMSEMLLKLARIRTGDAAFTGEFGYASDHDARNESHEVSELEKEGYIRLAYNEIVNGTVLSVKGMFTDKGRENIK